MRMADPQEAFVSVHTHRSRGLALVATVGVLACAPVTSSSYRNAAHTSPVPSLTAASRVIDAERIARSGSRTALDAVRAFVPRNRLREGGSVSPIEVSSGALSRGTMRVVLDGHALIDLELLRSIPAQEIIAIHVLSGSDAILRFGPSYEGGALVLETRLSLRNQ
jgi:hypothetical protein